MQHDDKAQVGDVCEVCPEGILLVQDIAQLLEKTTGAALIVDYGQEGSTDSIRAFSRHEQVHVLSRPGEVDVTADVDFEALRHAVNAKLEDTASNPPMAFGPVTQGKFLASMGAMDRVIQLIEDDNTTEEQAADLYYALERLVQPEHMGERYKVLAIARKKAGLYAPPGF
jgi:NADH dehydrogenase [ubiquinone] 1 alpha subcomplex assembly factor 7